MGGGEKVVVLDNEEDWLAPPPSKVPSVGLGLEEDSTIKELRYISWIISFWLVLCMRSLVLVL